MGRRRACLLIGGDAGADEEVAHSERLRARPDLAAIGDSGNGLFPASWVVGEMSLGVGAPDAPLRMRSGGIFGEATLTGNGIGVQGDGGHWLRADARGEVKMLVMLLLIVLVMGDEENMSDSVEE